MKLLEIVVPKNQYMSLLESVYDILDDIRASAASNGMTKNKADMLILLRTYQIIHSSEFLGVAIKAFLGDDESALNAELDRLRNSPKAQPVLNRAQQEVMMALKQPNTAKNGIFGIISGVEAFFDRRQNAYRQALQGVQATKKVSAQPQQQPTTIA